MTQWARGQCIVLEPGLGSIRGCKGYIYIFFLDATAYTSYTVPLFALLLSLTHSPHERRLCQMPPVEPFEGPRLCFNYKDLANL